MNLLPTRGEVYFLPVFLFGRQADELFRYLANNINWQQLPVVMFGRRVLQPRLTAFCADKGVDYVYSGLRLRGEGWPIMLGFLKRQVEQVCGQKFNSALLNLYRDGSDYIGWHRDNERALGKNPPVASVSLGATRRFQLRRHDLKSGPVTIELMHGSLLYMTGECQHAWEHRLPKAPRLSEPRINITFRMIRDFE